MAGLSAALAATTVALVGEGDFLGFDGEGVDHRLELFFDFGLLGLGDDVGLGLDEVLLHGVHGLDDVFVRPDVDDAVEGLQIAIELGGGIGKGCPGAAGVGPRESRRDDLAGHRRCAGLCRG